MRKLLPVIILVIIISTIVGYNMYNKSHVDTKDSKADVTISPSKLLSEFETDEAAANTKYLDQIIEVKGIVKLINQVETGGSLSLDSGNEMASIICEFESKESIAGVKVGDEVVVKGVCSGMLSDIVLVRCSL